METSPHAPTTRDLNALKERIGALGMTAEHLRRLMGSEQSASLVDPGPSEDTKGTTGRVTKACLACRKAKCKCAPPDAEGYPCSRCARVGGPCEFPRSRRGREKGSKNRLTAFEKSLKYLEKALDVVQADTRKPTGVGQMPMDLLVDASPGEAVANGAWETSTRLPASSSTNTVGHTLLLSDFTPSSAHAYVCTKTNLPFRQDKHGTVPDTGMLERVQSGLFSGDEEERAALASKKPEANPLHLLSSHSANFLAKNGGEENSFDASSPDSPDHGSQPASTSRSNASTASPAIYDLFTSAGWDSDALRRTSVERDEYFKHGPHSSKRDVGHNLDPVQRGIVSEDQAVRFFDEYFTHLHPLIGFLDPVLHRPTFVRSQSAFLFTVVLALGAALDEDTSGNLVDQIWNHAEMLVVAITAGGSKSIEIVQGLLLLILWSAPSPTMVDDRSWSYVGKAVRMATEIGLDLEFSPPASSDLVQRSIRDRARTWMLVVIQDRSLSAFTGRQPTLRINVAEPRLTAWLSSPLTLPADHLVIGFLHLRNIEDKLRGDIATHATLDALHGESARASANVLVNGWVKKWCTPQLRELAPTTEATMRLLALHVQLLLNCLVLRSGNSDTPSECYQSESLADCIRIAHTTLECFLSDFQHTSQYIPRTVCGMIAYAGTFLIKLTPGSPPLVVQRVALLLAGQPTDTGSRRTFVRFYGRFLISLIAERLSRSPDNKATSVEAERGLFDFTNWPSDCGTSTQPLGSPVVDERTVAGTIDWGEAPMDIPWHNMLDTYLSGQGASVEQGQLSWEMFLGSTTSSASWGGSGGLFSGQDLLPTAPTSPVGFGMPL